MNPREVSAFSSALCTSCCTASRRSCSRVGHDVVLVLVPLLQGRWHDRLGQELREIAQLVDDGKLEPLLDEQRFGFSEVGEAHRRLEASEHVGKITLENDL